MSEDLVGWCCMDCDENFYLEKNEESQQILGAITCPYCGEWSHTVLNTINKQKNKSDAPTSDSKNTIII